MDGAANFRDLGGYPTDDGRSVRWGRFYRSDDLHELSDADLQRFSELGIQMVCDFRGEEEWRVEPDRLPEDPAPRVEHLEIWDESFSGDAFREALSSGDLEGRDLGALLVEGNRLFATRFADRYAAMFERLLIEDNLPALVHCTAGKDRAGFASALILRTLGVPMETIFEDFLLTNHYTRGQTDRAILLIRLTTLFRVDGDQLRPVLGVERRYLEAAFAAIDERYGDFATYRREVLGIDDLQLARFREQNLE